MSSKKKPDEYFKWVLSICALAKSDLLITFNNISKEFTKKNKMALTDTIKYAACQCLEKANMNFVSCSYDTTPDKLYRKIEEMKSKTTKSATITSIPSTLPNQDQVTHKNSRKDDLFVLFLDEIEMLNSKMQTVLIHMLQKRQIPVKFLSTIAASDQLVYVHGVTKLPKNFFIIGLIHKPLKTSYDTFSDTSGQLPTLLAEFGFCINLELPSKRLLLKLLQQRTKEVDSHESHSLEVQSHSSKDNSSTTNSKEKFQAEDTIPNSKYEVLDDESEFILTHLKDYEDPLELSQSEFEKYWLALSRYTLLWPAKETVFEYIFEQTRSGVFRAQSNDVEISEDFSHRLRQQKLSLRPLGKSLNNIFISLEIELILSQLFNRLLHQEGFTNPISPKLVQVFERIIKACAVLQGKTFVSAKDVIDACAEAIAHRIILADTSNLSYKAVKSNILDEIQREFHTF